MEALTSLATAAGLGWASGVRLYAVVFFLGLLQFIGIYHLPEHLQAVANPWVMSASGFMFLIEFFADKLPGFDSVWDAAHTFIRIPAGALLAAAAVASGDPGMSIAAGILGGMAAAGSHVTKASARALINTSPEPLSNWSASVSEDAASIGMAWASIAFPLVALGFLVVFFGLAIWLVPKIWRGVKQVLSSIRQLLSSPASS